MPPATKFSQFSNAVRNGTHIYALCERPDCPKSRLQISIPANQAHEVSNLSQEKKRHLERFHADEYEKMYPKKKKEIPESLRVALVNAGFTTAAEICRMAPQMAAAIKNGGTGHDEEGIDGRVETEVENDVETVVEKEVGKETEVTRLKSTREIVLQVEEGPVTKWSEDLLRQYYMKINYVTSFDAGSPENEWIMRDRIPELMEVLHRKALNTPDKYNNKVIFTVRLKQPKSGEMTTMDISEKSIRHSSLWTSVDQMEACV